MVSFEVYPTSYQRTWANILHMSTGENMARYGDRTPGIWFHRNPTSTTTNKLHIVSAVNGNANYVHSSKKKFSINKWIKVKVEQREENEEAIYRIYLDDEKVHETINNKPSSFDNVKVYVSDQWYPAQKGKIRNLIINNWIAPGSILVYDVIA